MKTVRGSILSTLPGLCIFGLLSVLAAPALANPEDTVWVQDIHLHAPGPAELRFVYDRGQAPDDGLQLDLHRFVLRTAVGVDRAPMDFMPSVGFLQLGAEPARLDHVGLRVRWRLAGTPGEPVAALFAAYHAPMTSGAAHRLQQGVAAQRALGFMTLAGDLRMNEAFGGNETRLEVRAGLAATAGAYTDTFRIGAETFVLVPLKGARLSDAGLGVATDPAVYVGPSVRVHAESLWLSASVVTGRFPDRGAPLFVRVVLATQF